MYVVACGPTFCARAAPLQRKCSYCDFPVIAVGQDQAQTPRVQVRQ